MTLEDSLRQLADPLEPVAYAALQLLTDATAEELQQFTSVWEGLSSERKRESVRKLEELADNDARLDYSAVLRSCLADDDDVVREIAARGLWETEDRAYIAPLVQLLEHDASPRVRAAAALSLRNFAAMAQEGRLLARDGDRIWRALQSAAGGAHTDVELRRRAVESAAVFNTPASNAMALEAYESGQPLLVQSAIHGMGVSGNPDWLPTALHELNNPLTSVRYEAAIACGLLGEESATPQLERLLDDDDAEVRLACVRSIGMIGGELAKGILQRRLKDDDPGMQDAAREALIDLELQDTPLGFSFGGK